MHLVAVTDVGMTTSTTIVPAASTSRRALVAFGPTLTVAALAASGTSWVIPGMFSEVVLLVLVMLWGPAPWSVPGFMFAADRARTLPALQRPCAVHPMNVLRGVLLIPALCSRHNPVSADARIALTGLAGGLAVWALTVVGA